MLESLSTEELQFIKAIEKYKTNNGRLFLSWTEVLKILKQLGYRKISGKKRPEKSAVESPPRGEAESVASPEGRPGA